MSTAKAVAAGLAALLLLAGIGVAGYQFEWWLRGENTDRQVEIDNRNTGTQTAWRDEAHDAIADLALLPEGSPQAGSLRRQACDLIGRLTDPYVDDDLAAFQSTEC